MNAADFVYEARDSFARIPENVAQFFREAWCGAFGHSDVVSCATGWDIHPNISCKRCWLDIDRGQLTRGLIVGFVVSEPFHRLADVVKTIYFRALGECYFRCDQLDEDWCSECTARLRAGVKR